MSRRARRRGNVRPKTDAQAFAACFRARWIKPHIRRITLSVLDLAQDTQRVIDSLPIALVQFHLVPSSAGDWAAHGARFGRCATKKQTIFGYRLQLLITLGGTILNFELTSANCDDRYSACDLLFDKRDLLVIGDKGFISKPFQNDSQSKTWWWRTKATRCYGVA